MAANSVRVAKQGLRKKIRRALVVMSEEQKREESELLVKKVDRANWEALITQYILPPFSCYVLPLLGQVRQLSDQDEQVIQQLYCTIHKHTINSCCII